MRIILTSVFTGLCLALSPVLAHTTFAQSKTESSIAAVQDMAEWSQQALAIQTGMMDLFAPDLMEELFAVLDSENTDDIERYGQNYEAHRQVILARAKSQIDALPPPEKWNIDPNLFSKTEAGIFRATKKQYNAMDEMYSEFEIMSGALSDILINIESNNLNALEDINEIQVKSAVKLIELENQQIDGYIAAIPKDNPNYDFQKIVKQVNLVSLAEMGLSLDLNYNLEDRRRVGQNMRSQAEPIPDLIQSGRLKLKNQLRELKSIPLEGSPSQERDFIENVIVAISSFDETFDIENKIFKNLDSSATLYLSNASDEEIEGQIDEIDLEFLRLIDERANLMQKRISLLQ